MSGQIPLSVLAKAERATSRRASAMASRACKSAAVFGVAFASAGCLGARLPREVGFASVAGGTMASSSTEYGNGVGWVAVIGVGDNKRDSLGEDTAELTVRGVEFDGVHVTSAAFSCTWRSHLWHFGLLYQLGWATHWADDSWGLGPEVGGGFYWRPASCRGTVLFALTLSGYLWAGVVGDKSTLAADGNISFDFAIRF